MGPEVKYAQGIYLFLEGLALVGAVAMVGLAAFKGKKFFDRSIQLVIDDAGIHDYRAAGKEIAWPEVAELSEWSLYSGAIATAAQLKVVTKDGPTVGIDILGLDRDHKSIGKAAKKMMRKGGRGSS
jgi:hypothetical protein